MRIPPSLSSKLPYLYGLGAILCWASLAAAVGESLRNLAPEAVLFYGLLAAAVSLMLWQAARRRPLRWPGLPIALLGVYGIWGYHTLLVLALSMAPQIEANILNYAWPLWIVLMGAALPGHRLSGRIALAGLLGFAGVVLVIGGGHLPGLGGDAAALGEHLPGYAVAVAAGLCWASFTVLLRRFVPPGEDAMPLFCVLAVAPAGALVLARGVPLAVAPEQIPLLLYFGLVPLGLSFVLWERAVQGCNVQVLGILSFLTPVLSTLMLGLVSGRAPGAGALAGLALIVAGSALARKGA